MAERQLDCFVLPHPLHIYKEAWIHNNHILDPTSRFYIRNTPHTPLVKTYCKSHIASAVARALTRTIRLAESLTKVQRALSRTTTETLTRSPVQPPHTPP